MARGALLILLAACHPDPGPPAASCDASLDWENAGAPFTTTWCTPCHAPGAVRFGAPESVDLVTLADVRAHADRVRIRALPDDATMPPTGPAPADERARFAAWLDCGAPGTTTAAPAPCAGGVSAGDLRTTDPAPCPGITSVAGDLWWDGAAAGWDCLCAVEGAVRVGPEATSLALPDLATAGELDASGGALVELDLPGLVAVAGSITLRDQPALAVVRLPLLDTVGGLSLEELPALDALEVFRLAVVAADLRLSAVPVLDAPILDALASVGGTLELRGTGATAPLLARNLRSVGGDLVLVDSALLTSLGGLDLLTSVGGSLVIESNPVLTAIPGLPGPTTVGGDLSVRDNAALPSAEATGLADRLEVSGGTELTGNAP